MNPLIETVRVAIDRLEGEGSDIEWCGFIDALARIEALLAAYQDIPPTNQLRMWLKEDLVGLLDDLRAAQTGEETGG